MIKKIIAGICLLFSSVVFSQESNASPYSYFGIGDIKFKGTTENRSMGGLGILPDSIHVNLQNPAAYASLMYTTFTVSASNSKTRFKTDSASDNANRTTVDYIAVAIPYKKLGFAFGLMPYTAVGYRIKNETVGPVAEDTIVRTFNGSGGLNRVFGGVAYKISPKFSIGAEFQYNFGQVKTKSITNIKNEVQVIQYPTRETNNSDYNGFSFNIGAIYQGKIGKYDWVTSAAFTPQSTLKSSTDRELATITITNSNNEIVHDNIDTTVSTSDVKMPAKASFGSGLGQNRSWFIGAEYTFQQSNELGNRFDNVTNAKFETAHKFSLGGYFIPKYASFTSYISRITYRAGLRYEKTGLVINGEAINDMGLSLGVGLPIGGRIGGSNLNIGAEFGQRGTTSANLVKENYVNLFISLSINDRWFQKRRYE
ncbi:hypothetical protein HYN59_07300 [Flavobacterium album]|uniref:Aromatic hydrocarbon degradation protein n=1 Tax=Flavobacterium album TaxID=2175091 RepID=A0A2S1QX34_9FLAO|nr:hypothetical protein [Flavobacterium album]AWH84944.1 hypothetical protein HYN59_07300 [Flavobacterium album]